MAHGQGIAQEGAGGGYLTAGSGEFILHKQPLCPPSALSPLPSSYSPLKWIQFSQVFRFSHCRSSDSLRNEAHEAGLGDGVDKDETDETCISQC